MLDRLVGLETEYALRFHPTMLGGKRTANSILYERLEAAVQERILTVPAQTPMVGHFLANGGALHFERVPVVIDELRIGIVEGATPECRGPRQLLVYQRAQDRLLAEAVLHSSQLSEGAVTLVKNNRDGGGWYYGSHENYEATIASGFPLLVWRIGLILLVPVAQLYLVCLPLVIWAIMVSMISLALAAAAVVGEWLCHAMCLITLLGGGWLWWRSRRSKARAKPQSLRNQDDPRLLFVLTWYLIVIFAPLMLLLTLLVRLTAFRTLRRRLLPFLISRPIIAGAGALDLDGKTFRLSTKAPACRSVCGVFCRYQRPIFYFGHVFKGLLSAPMNFGRFRALFRPRQRFQVCLGDSNMAQVAEYLRVGTTLLVLDAIEGGELDDAPDMCRPMRALRTICADPTLQATVRLSNGQAWTALQIQRFYLEACRRFLQRSPAAPSEAWRILSSWGETLETLEKAPEQLVGQIDWVTKRYLIEQAGPDASVAARRKIDVRYHELCAEGYFRRLEANGLAPVLVGADEVREATQLPPSSSPAATRGRIIREYSGGPVPVHAGWESIVIGQDWGRKTIWLGNYRTVSNEAPGEPGA
jgi:hypothetical protein